MKKKLKFITVFHIMAAAFIVMAAFSFTGCAKDDSNSTPGGETSSSDLEDGSSDSDGEDTDKEASGGEGASGEASGPVEGDLNIEKVENLSPDFIMGMDISSVMSEFDSGVVYKDFDGNEINNITDFCKFLAQCGITHVRVRVWNDPYDSEGRGYGGGNNDVNRAKEIADGCREAGLKMLVNFHCSDMWADPSKYQAPKAWKDYSADEKGAALKTFLTESLNTIDPAGDVVTMVQVGNETTNGFMGENAPTVMCGMFKEGAAGVREYNSEVKIVIHVTNPEQGNIGKWANLLNRNEVDYDVLATSYYPYWHGTFENLESEFARVRDVYKKEYMVVETSYAYTLFDSDGFDNTVRVGSNDSGDNITEPFTEQGQANAIRNIINVVNDSGGLGVFYWEPAWITVGDTTGLTGEEYDKRVEENKAIWEEYGSGWASSFAGSYSADEGEWYGGTAVDNEAMFYPDGSPSPALHVWNYVKTGAVTDKVYEEVIPESEEEEEEDVNKGENLITDADDAGIEKADNFVHDGEEWITVDGFPSERDAKSGLCMHWYSTKALSDKQLTYNKPIKLEAGDYVFEVQAHGLEGEQIKLQVLDKGGHVIEEGSPTEMAGWNNWQTPKVKFTLKESTKVKLRIVYEIQTEGWGSIDDLYLYKAE